MIASTATRLLPLPSLRDEYALVSMPETAWYWLDDLVERSYPEGYGALMTDMGSDPACAAGLPAALARRAREHGQSRMAALYHLANDNHASENASDLSPGRTSVPPPAMAGSPEQPDMALRMPFMYQLFHFLPHATHLTTVWERRNYHLRGHIL